MFGLIFQAPWQMRSSMPEPIKNYFQPAVGSGRLKYYYPMRPLVLAIALHASRCGLLHIYTYSSPSIDQAYIQIQKFKDGPLFLF